MTRLIDLKAHGKLELNGESIELDHMEIKHWIAKVAQVLINSSIQGRDFSSLKLSLSKRPITESSDDPEMDQFLKDNTIHINYVQENDIIEGETITWGQYESLRATPEWTNRFALQIHPQNYTEPEAQSIKQAYDDRFLGTDFYGVGLKL